MNVTVSLRWDPVDDAVVSIVSANSNAVSVAPSSLTFTSGNYATPQTFTLTGLHDADVRNVVTSIVLSSAAAPNDQTLPVTVVDDDVQSIIVNANTVNIDEGTDGFLTIRLAFDPVDPTQVTIVSSNPAAASLSGTNFTFDSSNYATPQTLTITGDSDNNVLDASTVLTLSSTNASQDQTVNVNINDDDVQALIVSQSTLNIDEGSSTTFTVRLAFDPVSASTVAIASSDVAAVSTDLSLLAFDSANYATPQTLIVTSGSDNDTANEVVNLTVSGGGANANTVVTVNVTDDDVQTIILTATSTSTIDEGDSVTFTVRLAFDPLAVGDVTVVSSAPGSAGVSPGGLSFTTQNYMTPQTITINALQDLDASNEAVTITVSGGGAPNSATVNINIIDDEEQNIVLSTNSVTLPEASAGSVDVRLAFAPSIETIVTIISSDTGVAVPGVASLTFNVGNWNVAQTVSFTTLDDLDVVDSIAQIIFASTVINEDEILTVTVTDDDEQSIIVDTSPVQLYEISSVFLNVRLAYRPVGTTTVTISSDNGATATVSPTILAFTEANYNIDRIFEIAGVGDTNTTDDSTTVRLQEPFSNNNPAINVTVTDVDAIQGVSSEPPPTGGIGGLARSLQPSITSLPNEDIAIAWHDIAPSFGGGNDYDIILRTYVFGVGANATTLVSNHANDGDSRRTQIAADLSGVTHIVWQDDGAISDSGFDDDVIYRRYENGSLDPNFILISTGAGTDDSVYPDVTVDTVGIVHVVWQDDGDLADDGFPDNDIYYSRGTITGGFSAPIVVNSDDLSDGDSVRPKVAIANDGCPHVVWQDDGDIVAVDQDGNDDIYYRGSNWNAAGGCTWGATTLITIEANFTNAYAPRLVIDPVAFPTALWVVWHGNGDVLNSGADHDIFVRTVTSTAIGVLNLVSNDALDNSSQSASITLDSNTNVHIYWQDTGNIANTGTDLDIFERTWNGSTWGTINPISDPDSNAFNTGISRDSAVISIQTRRYLVWDDTSDYDGDGIADDDIMYKLLR